MGKSKVKSRKAKKPKHYWFYDHLYLFNFRLVWPVKPKALARYIRREFGNKVSFQPYGAKALKINPACGPDCETYMIALGREWKGNADCHSQLSHECVHIAGMVLADRGMDYDAEHDEPLAYLHGYVLRQCLNVLMPPDKRVEVSDEVKPRNSRRSAKMIHS